MRTRQMLYFVVFLYFCSFVQAQRANNGGCQTPDGQTGVCIPVQTCKTMTDFLAKVSKPIPADVKAKLKPYQCGAVGTRPKVCCPPKSISFDEPKPAAALDSFEFPDVSNHKNLKLLPKNCGHLDTVMKIVNGNKTSLFEFPWMTLLSYQTKSGRVDFKCGGTVINERYILTAAHCVTNLENTKEKLKLRGVRVGEHDIRTNKDCEEEDDEEICAPPVQDLSVEEVISHKNYNTRTHVHDIALLRVNPPLDLNQENCRPVCLPLGNIGNFNYTNRRVVVTGWGFTETGRPSPVLLKAELPVSPLKECQDKYKKLYKMTEKQLCAGGDGKSDSCGGDSGGPLHSLEVLHDEPRYIQQGIVSFGPADCGKVALPGVYTRVASYMDWILDNMKP